MEQFDALLVQTIDSALGLRCTLFGYQYSEILRSLMCVYLCCGSCIEDISTHLMKHLSLHPTLRTCSADTILRAIEELTCKNTTYKSASGNELFYYTWPKDATYKYEIDFLVSRGSKICPIEVKSSGYKSHAHLMPLVRSSRKLSCKSTCFMARICRRMATLFCYHSI